MAQKMSLFAQRMKLQREEKLRTQSATNNVPPIAFGDKSYILTGAEAEELHEANIQKLSGMSPEEIAEERNKLISELDPKLVNFLRLRRKEVDRSPSSPESSRIQPHQSAPERKEVEPMDTVTSESSELRIPDIVVEEVKELSKYPHMDIVEKDKLQWIGELPLQLPPPSDPYPARFNFQGELLPYSDGGEGVLQGLHNHGEEPERPGYTLQELIQLTRSSVLQQRLIALNSLANIMTKAWEYDECLSESILPALLEADLFLLLRFSLDDPASSVVMASASALSALLASHTDEVCLDSLLGTPLGLEQPSLAVILEMKQADIDELKDQQLFKLDVIRGALRTDLLQRFKYILTELKPEPVEIKQLLKALIRISRHSYEIANKVFIFPGLLDTVRSLLDVRESSSYYPEALKLFRIISSRSHSLAGAIYDKYDILKPIFTFIAGEKAVGHPEAMHLTLESFYTWQSLLSYNIATETIGSLSPVLMRLVETHLGLTNIDGSTLDLEHATALVSTVSVVAKLNFNEVRHILPLLSQATSKWFTQYISSNKIKFSASKLLGSCLILFASVHDYFSADFVLLPAIEKILTSPCSKDLLFKLRKCSWLIEGEILSSPENLPRLGCIPPTVRSDSCLPLLYSMAAYLHVLERNRLIEVFLGKPELIRYIKSVLQGDNITKLCGHWYARQELNFLVILVHLFTLVDVREHQNVFHKLAFQLLTSVQMGDRALLPEIISNTIFNPKFFSDDVESVSKKLEELSINKSEDKESTSNQRRHSFLKDSMKALPSIEKLYIRELGLEGLTRPRPPVSLTGLLNSTQSALPQDWPFLPILRLHERQGKDKNAVSIVTLSLQWFIIIEELLPEVFSFDCTAKYCRLSCIFLAGNGLFQDITDYLEVALYYVLKQKDKLDFESPVPGLTSFYDFYRELLEEYGGVSYGNTVFGQYVLVPLQQRHNVKYKKIIWSELASVLRLLRTPTLEVDMSDYLTPCETDSDLLRIYLHSVGTGKIRELWCPVLYNVAVHHVAVYIRTHTDSTSKLLHSMVNSLGNQELKNLYLTYDVATDTE